MYEDGALRNALWQLFTQVLELQKCRSKVLQILEDICRKRQENTETLVMT